MIFLIGIIKVATSATSGGGASWTSGLSAPHNGHTHWITLRDIGTAGAEESLYAPMTNLVAGWEYEVTVYNLTARTGMSGGSYYAGTYIDKFDFQVGEETEILGNGRILSPNHSGTQTRVSVTNVSRDLWGISKLRFTASNSTMYLAFFPGNDSGNGTPGNQNFECVNLSVSLNAINKIPQAQNKTATTNVGVPVTINALQGAQDPDTGQIIVPGNVDLNPSTPGINQSVTTAQGTWTVNSSGVVTFTPAAGFYGVATINYTSLNEC